MEATKTLDDMRASGRAEQVEGVAKGEVGIGQVQAGQVDALERGRGGDRHEAGRRDGAVRRVEDACAGRRAGGLVQQLEMHRLGGRRMRQVTQQV